MSVKIMSAVWEHSKQEGGALLVLLALADFANDDGESWYGVKKIAAKSRLKERQVQNILRKLQADGEIEVRIGGGMKVANNSGNTNRYRVKYENLTPGANTTPGVVRCANPVHSTAPPPVHSTAPKPSGEPSENRQAGETREEPTGTLSDTAPSSARSNRPDYSIEVENILSECDRDPKRSHYRQALEDRERREGSKIQHRNAWRRTLLHGWHKDPSSAPLPPARPEPAPIPQKRPWEGMSLQQVKPQGAKL